jgi:hypothetical protein
VKIQLFALAFALALPVASAAGQTAYGGPNAAKSRITIRVDRAVVKSGSKIVVGIKETFTSDGVDGINTGLESQYGLDVLLANGKAATFTEQGRKWNWPEIGSGFVYDVKAGRTDNSHLVVSDIYDMTQPGKYSVQVNRGKLKSNTITLTVVP